MTIVGKVSNFGSFELMEDRFYFVEREKCPTWKKIKVGCGTFYM